MSERGVIGLIFLALVVIVAAVVYAHKHADRYRDCIIKPATFSWPADCPGGEIMKRS